MKPTPQQSTSERLGVINLLLCQASLQYRHTNKGMRLLLTKEERRGNGKRKENMYNFSENKRKDTPKTKFRGFIKNMAVIGANSAEFFLCVSTAFLRRSLLLKMLIFLYWSISRERCSRVDWSLTLSGSYLPHIWSFEEKEGTSRRALNFFIPTFKLTRKRCAVWQAVREI